MSDGREPGGGGNSGGDANELAGVVETMSFSGALVDYFVRLDGPGETSVRVQSTPPIAAQPGARVMMRFPVERTVVLES